MAQRDRIQIFPSRANQVLIKQRTLAALRGANLLKRKRDAIDMKLRELKQDMQDREDVSNEIMRAAIFAFARANFLDTDFKVMQVEDVDTADAYIIRRSQKIVGITLPQLDLMLRSEGAFPLTGLARGGGQVGKLRILFQEALKNLVACASMDFALRMLSEAARQNNMRVNALDHVVVPRLVNTWTYIRDELEEFEREDFYRLKRSQANQLQAKIQFTELIKTKNMTDSERQLYLKSGVHHHPVADISFALEQFDSKERLTRRRELKDKLPRRQSEVSGAYKFSKVPNARQTREVKDAGEGRAARNVERALQTDFEDYAVTQTEK